MERLEGEGDQDYIDRLNSDTRRLNEDTARLWEETAGYQKQTRVFTGLAVFFSIVAILIVFV